MSLVLRFIQGIASAILNTSSYSFVSLIFPDKHKLESAIQMLEATSGIGLILGPIIGSSIYTQVGFKGTFLILGAALVPLAIIINCILLSVRNKSVSDEQLREPLLGADRAKSMANPQINRLSESSEEEEVADEEKIGNLDLIKSPRLVFACLCGALSYFCDTQLESIFAPRLAEFGLTTMQVGYMFTIIPLTYIPSMLIVQCFPRWVSKRFTLILSAILLGCATFMNGPS